VAFTNDPGAAGAAHPHEVLQGILFSSLLLYTVVHVFPLCHYTTCCLCGGKRVGGMLQYSLGKPRSASGCRRAARPTVAVHDTCDTHACAMWYLLLTQAHPRELLHGDLQCGVSSMCACTCPGSMTYVSVSPVERLILVHVKFFKVS
jgi:hypothetical protein